MAIGDVSGSFNTGAYVEPGKQFQQGTGSTVNPLHIEQYGGAVETRFVKASFMRQYADIKTVRGTDTVTNDRMGKTSIQAVAKGVRPEGGGVDFDNVSVKVDTIILARNNVALLDEFQQHFDTRVSLGEDHGKEIGKFFDEAFIIQSIKAAMINAEDHRGNATSDATVQRLPEGWGHGTVIDLASSGDEEDPDKLLRAIEDMMEGIELQDVEAEGGVLLMNATQYNTLLRNDKLINADYSLGNGDYAKGMVLQANGVRVVKTNRIPKAAISGHYLSNAGNNNAYDVSSAEAKTKVIYLQPRSLLAGETIPLTSKVYYSDVELQWFIDSYLSFGVTPNRPEFAGIVRAA
jgi:hypothetical protein